MYSNSWEDAKMSCLKKLITLLKLKVHKFILNSRCFIYKNPGASTSTYKDCSGRTLYICNVF